MKRLNFLLICLVLIATAIAFGQEAPVATSAPQAVDAPEWLLSLMAMAESVPVVGPILVEVAKWLGVLASVLTILVTALLGIIRALGAVLPAVKLAELATKVLAFENSKVMYWLKFFSVYNAKKVDSGNSK